jgi:uncharacterized membrane protein YoaK (UPF0700 family)
VIELTQFIKWQARRAWELPGRLHSRLTDSLDESDWFMSLFFSSLVTFIAGFLVGVVLHKITGGHVICAILALIIWTTGAVFIVTAGIRAMHRAFRREQEEFIRKLKSEI